MRGTALGGAAGITAILVHSVGDFNLHIPANALLFTILAAMVAGPLPKTIDNTETAIQNDQNFDKLIYVQ
ncbi:Uncharacterized protein dnl_14460 [Desulfonema limicola]|uniref:Uncharacterized protein n=1 Tax=Desulfonema limicola TaxID=45656 RepID=A0A975B5L4_9BACT|nr:hypothetical protein [Desulfonema limicola]QTA79192.1 Uncharacterized protein dnl_14460 [Desulfonema limicola]